MVFRDSVVIFQDNIYVVVGKWARVLRFLSMQFSSFVQKQKQKQKQKVAENELNVWSKSLGSKP